MSLTEPSGTYSLHDVNYCARCGEDREGTWVGDPTKPMAFRCARCTWETTGAEA